MSAPDDGFTPGLLSASQAAALMAMGATVRATRRDLDSLVIPGDPDIDVKVTAYDAGTGYYTWNQVRPGTSGVFYDDPTGFGGSPTLNPLVERNLRVVSNFPFYTSARPLTVTASVGRMWEFTATRTMAGWIQFVLPTTMGTTTTTVTSCSVAAYWDGTTPGTRATVMNMPASTNYVFSGTSGAVGYAVWDEVLKVWRIVQMQC